MNRNIFTHLFDSFTNGDGGFSARKLSAFAGVITSIVITVMFTDSTNLSTMVTIWLMFAGLCMSIITVEQIIRFKEGRRAITNMEISDVKREEIKADVKKTEIRADAQKPTNDDRG